MGYTFDRLIEVENTMRRVSSAMRPLASKQISDDLLTLEHILSVVRFAAQSLERDAKATDEDIEASTQNLVSGLFR